MVTILEEKRDDGKATNAVSQDANPKQETEKQEPPTTDDGRGKAETVMTSLSPKRPKTRGKKGTSQEEDYRGTRSTRIRFPHKTVNKMSHMTPGQKQDFMASLCFCIEEKIDVVKWQESVAQVRTIGQNLNSALKVWHVAGQDGEFWKVVLELREFCDSLGGRHD